MSIAVYADAPQPVAVVPIHTDRSFGAEITGLDLRAITEAGFATIHQAWIDHQVLLFRGQTLSDHDLVAFSRRFGDLDHAPVQENGQRFVEGMVPVTAAGWKSPPPAPHTPTPPGPATPAHDILAEQTAEPSRAAFRTAGRRASNAAADRPASPSPSTSDPAPPR